MDIIFRSGTRQFVLRYVSQLHLGRMVHSTTILDRLQAIRVMGTQEPNTVDATDLLGSKH